MVLFLIIIVVVVLFYLIRTMFTTIFDQLNNEVLEYLNLEQWLYNDYDEVINLKSSKGVDNYDKIKFIKENRDEIDKIKEVLQKKTIYAARISNFLEENEYKNRFMYNKLQTQLTNNLKTLDTYNIKVFYISPAGRSRNKKVLRISEKFVDYINSKPELIMSKTEYNKYVKDINKEKLIEKQHTYYDMVNDIVDIANFNREKLIKKEDKERLDNLVSLLFEKTVNSIKKIKQIESEEWELIKKIILNISKDVKTIVDKNNEILEYYESPSFKKIKASCNSLMQSQREFNEYINEKAKSLSSLLGMKIIRNETEENDKYNYVRSYKKTIAPFSAEVSAQVFSSAENNPLEYIVKAFYPDKTLYKEQILKLQLLVEELETLRDARIIIDNQKKEYQKYLIDVPQNIMENDKEGFYSRLGFANISESILNTEYRFSYTSSGGMVQRSFTVPMTEETIIRLINILQTELTIKASSKEQRALMTSKLRQTIKERDNYTCKKCGNSIYKEPNLLLEIDHIIPVSKGGKTVENNLQVLCWKCNREKSNKKE